LRSCDVPLVGFFAAGEIAHQNLYGYSRRADGVVSGHAPSGGAERDARDLCAEVKAA